MLKTITFIIANRNEWMIILEKLILSTFFLLPQYYRAFTIEFRVRINVIFSAFLRQQHLFENYPNLLCKFWQRCKYSNKVLLEKFAEQQLNAKLNTFKNFNCSGEIERKFCLIYLQKTAKGKNNKYVINLLLLLLIKKNEFFFCIKKYSLT